MPTNHRRPAAEQKFWDDQFSRAWEQCLREMGLVGAIGCAHVAREAADKALIERTNSLRGAE